VGAKTEHREKKTRIPSAYRKGIACGNRGGPGTGKIEKTGTILQIRHQAGADGQKVGGLGKEEENGIGKSQRKS